MVHRDIKPDNIYLIDAGYELFVKVLDFGIAKQTQKLGVASVTDTGAIIGTPEYMSPEQLLSPKSADWRADTWALAVLAYRALTGHVPFTGETLPSLSLSICNGQFEPPSRRLDGLPDGIDDWFTRALQPKPEERFASVGEMAQGLTELLRDSHMPPVSIAGVDTERPSGGESGTLASAMSEAAPAHADTVDVAVEEADDDPDAKPLVGDGGPGLMDEGRSESSRRRGPVVIELARPRSSGRNVGYVEREIPSTMRFDENAQKRYGRLKLAGLILTGILCVAAADFIFRGSGEVPKPEIVPSAQRAPASDELWSENTAVVAPAQPLPPAPAAPEPTTSASSAEPDPPVAVAPVPVRRPPQPAKTVQPEDPCKNPYIVLKDGTYKIKPGCAKR